MKTQLEGVSEEEICQNSLFLNFVVDGTIGEQK